MEETAKAEEPEGESRRESAAAKGRPRSGIAFAGRKLCIVFRVQP